VIEMKKKAIALVLALIFALSFTAAGPVLAAEPSAKEEVVYGMLNLDGTVNNLYVVNIFSGGAITDYGNYSDIRNMTTSEKLNYNGDEITINTDAAKFYYQGTLGSKELPWDIDIKYFLDGQEIAGKDIVGKTGKVEIALSVKENPNVSRTYFDNYALQIALALDNKLFTNIETENATIAEAGGKKQLAYTVLPGNGMDISVTADVQDFEMDSITINGIKLSLGISVDSNEMISGQMAELADAIEGLDSGAGELLAGLNELAKGMQKYTDGIKAFKDGLGQFATGAGQLNFGATELKNGLAELAGQNEAIIQGTLAIQQATFDSVNAELSGMGLPVLTPDNYSAILSSIPDLAVVKAQLDGSVQFSQGIIGYTGGVAQLGQGAAELARGTEEFAASASELATSASELYLAAAEINAGIKKLRDGLASYKEGTKELKNGTANMGPEIDKMIDELLGSISGTGDEVMSFVSAKNTNVTAVQFVLKTGPILRPEAPAVPPEEPAQLTFWQRLAKLFTSLFR